MFVLACVRHGRVLSAVVMAVSAFNLYTLQALAVLCPSCVLQGMMHTGLCGALGLVLVMAFLKFGMGPGLEGYADTRRYAHGAGLRGATKKD